MKNISLLDCTLRDGGYINNWHFGEGAIKGIAKRIVLAGIEYFEVGFIRDCTYDKDKSLFDGNESVKGIILPKNYSTKYVGMIDMGNPISLKKLGERQEDGFDVLRVIFKKDKKQEAYEYIQRLLDMGYDVFVQPVGTDNYSDREFIDLILYFNSLEIQAFYIVDSFGVIKKKQFMRLMELADNNLRKGIILGYHSHNNMQQALGNAIAMSEAQIKRDIIIDACVFGMGRGAGNLNMELFAEYMNENYDKSYRIEPILEIIDEYLNDIYKKNFWGYSLPLYLSAVNNCHPNYATFFASKGTLTVKSYNEILKTIPIKDKAIYNEARAEEIYRDYQENYIDDRKAVKELADQISNKSILLLGPGKSLRDEKEAVDEFIRNQKPLILSLNFIPQDYECDFVFSCHMRRYKDFQERTDVKKIITSNLREAKNYQYILNFSSYAAENTEIMENSGIMCINFLISLGIKEVWLAGLDGYDKNNHRNYINSGLEYSFSEETLNLRNQLIAEEIENKREKIKIHFITNSLYKK